MEWLSQNWVWVLFAVAMIVMHMGHGGHGGHGSGPPDNRKRADGGDDERASEREAGHHH